MAFPLLRAASFARLACGRNHSTIGCGCQGESRDQSIKNTDRVAALIHDLSCSAKAEHPVNAVGAVITGSSAGACHRAGHFGPDPLADDDRSILSPPPLHPSPQIIEIDLELLGLADFVFDLAMSSGGNSGAGVPAASTMS